MSVFPRVAEAWCHHLAPAAMATVSCYVRLSQKGGEGHNSAGVPAAVRPAQTCQSCLNFVCVEEWLLMLFVWCFYFFVGIDVSFLQHGTPVLCCHTNSLKKAWVPFGWVRQSPLIGGKIQPGRLGLVLLLCSNKTFEGSLIILSRLISIFSWMCLLLYVVKWSIWIVVKFMWIRLGRTQHQLLSK